MREGKSFFLHYIWLKIVSPFLCIKVLCDAIVLYILFFVLFFVKKSSIKILNFDYD